MFFHIHKICNNIIPVVALFPTKFIDVKIAASRQNGVNTPPRSYNIHETYGSNPASGLDVLLDFVGAGENRFKKTTVMDFKEITLSGNTP